MTHHSASDLQRLATLCAQPESDVTFDEAMENVERHGLSIDLYCESMEYIHEMVRLCKKRRAAFDRIWDLQPAPAGVSKEFSFLIALGNDMGVAAAMYAKDWRANDLRIVENLANSFGQTAAERFAGLMFQYLNKPFVKDVTPHVPTSNTRN